MKKKHIRRIFRCLLWVVCTPVLLFLLVALLVYFPPVQKWLVGRVADSVGESTGMRISVGSVRLAFPLDLAVGDFVACDATDTIVSARTLRLDVQLIPLFSGRADIDGFGLFDAKVNTKGFVADTRIRGNIKRLEAKSHGVEWGNGKVHLDDATLSGANLYVALSDTAKEEPDTVPSMPWTIDADRILLENTAVALSLPGDTMRLAAKFGRALLTKGHFDTGSPLYTIGSLNVEKGEVTYATTPGPRPAPQPPVVNNAFYQTNNLLWNEYFPSQNLDPSYIHLTGLQLALDSLSYDSVGTLRLALNNLAFKEHCGLEVKRLASHVYMDTARLRLPDLALATAASTINANVDFGFDALTPGKNDRLSATISSSLGSADIKQLARGYLDDALLQAWPNLPLTLKAHAEGNIDHLSLSDVAIGFPGCFGLTADASADNLLADNRRLSARFRMQMDNMDFLNRFLPDGVAETFSIPRGTVLQGSASMAGNAYDANVRLASGGGSVAMKADIDLDRERYNVDLRAKNFPLNRFLPTAGVGSFSGSATASGRHFDLLSAASSLQANASIDDLTVGGLRIGGISFKATSQNGQTSASFAANNEVVRATGTFAASLSPDIDATLNTDIESIDLRRLGIASDTLEAGGTLALTAHATKDFMAYSAKGSLSNIHFMTPTRGIPAKDLLFDFATSPDTTTACIAAGDLDLDFGAKGNLDCISSGFSRFAKVFAQQLEQKRIDQEQLRRAFPVVDLHLTAGRDNPLSRILHYKGIVYSSAEVELSANPRDGIGGHINIGQLEEGSVVLDTIYAELVHDTAGLNLNAVVHNFKKQNPNKFKANVNAYAHNSGIGASLGFVDVYGREGINLGLTADFSADGLTLAIAPHHPIIAYRTFTVNSDNYIFLGHKQQLRADVNLVADDGTALSLTSEPADSVNDITLSVHNINLGELSSVLPYLPQMSGMLNGDVHVVDDHLNKSFSAAAQMNAESFVYEGASLGNLGIEAFYMPQTDGKHYANAYISTEGTEVLQCEGTYDNTSERFSGNANLHDCPLRLLNGFLAGTDIAMRGTAAGDLAVEGTFDRPVINGSLNLDTAHIYSDVYGLDFLMDEQPLTIENSRLLFNQYKLRSAKSENPLVLNGTFDMSNFDRMSLDLTMKASDFELVNAKKNTLSLLYGKIYANYVGTLRGALDNLSVRGKLEILDRTDMTYILKDSPLTVDDRLGDLVQFVSFTDTTTVAEEPAPELGGIDLTLGISISDAARFNCALSEDGSNYVNLEGGGDLTLRLTQQGDMRLTGRFTANSGEMKYSLPVIPLKTFNIQQGSYVEFTGDVANPTLSITAKERVRATVTENDQPRTVPFDVGVSISQTLSDMGLTFLIESSEDLSVQNQLAQMSTEQRSKAAVAMLATGLYLTDETLSSSSSGFKASNALNAFLQNEIQSIAGSALKTIDLSIGMENNTSSTGTETTDYSFQFAKRFWNNRISVIIGGKVSTGSDAKNSAESFIDNISVEYRLDKSATRYVKVFYDRSTRDPLEGQLMKTGAGVVLRRKTDRLGELFIFSSKKKKNKTEEAGSTE